MASAVVRTLPMALLCLVTACTAFGDLPQTPSASDNGPAPDKGDTECGEDAALCDGLCVDTASSVNHCGGCQPCVAGANSVPACLGGACVFECGAGFVDRDGDLERGKDGDGCECQAFAEVCDTVDNDCDGEVDEGTINACGGCVGLEGEPGAACGECGLWSCRGEEAVVCEETTRTFFEDGDGDSFGVGPARVSCGPEGVFTALREGDCDDEAPTTFPGASELCDGVDNDCDEDIDEAVLNACGGCALLLGEPGAPCRQCGEVVCVDPDTTACEEPLREFFEDGDEDGFGAGEARALCGPTPPFTALRSGDCDDGDPNRFPGHPEICDGLDNNCDLHIDLLDGNFEAPSCALTEGACATATAECVGGLTLSCQTEDYIEAAADIGLQFELSPEVLCDGADNDCNGAVDEHCCEEPALAVRPVGDPPEGVHQITPSISLTPNGESAALAWIDTTDRDRPNPDEGTARLSVVDRNGRERFAPIDPDTPGRHTLSAVAAHDLGVDWLFVADDEERSVRWRRVSMEGQIIARDTLEETRAEQVAVSARPDGHAVALWTRQAQINNGALILQTISPDNALGNTHSLDPFGAKSPQVLATGSGGVVVFHNDRLFDNRLEWLMLDEDLTPIDERWERNTATDDSQPVVAEVDDGFIIVHRDLNNDEVQIRLFRLNRNGSRRGGNFTLFTTDEPLSGPVVVSFGDGSVVVWHAGLTTWMLEIDDEGRPLGDPIDLGLPEQSASFKPLAIARGPDVLNPASRWFSLAISSSLEDNEQGLDRLKLVFFRADGDPLCFR